MRYLDEYRDGASAERYAKTLRAMVTRPWTLMEVCGGQTHAIVRYGIDEMLPPGVTLIHGPGCPVCVTPVASLDRAFRIARQPGVVFASFGDMLRVPGSSDDLLVGFPLGQRHGIERRVDDAHVAAVRAHVQEVVVAAGDPQHVAE